MRIYSSLVKKFWLIVFYEIAVCVVRALVYWPTGGIKGYQKRNVPMKGPIIIAPNHISHLDPPAIALTCPRRLRFMAKEELFKNKYFAVIIRLCRAFPVKRGVGDTEAIRWTLASLENQEGIMMFPEGTRGDGVNLGFVNRGIAMIAKRSGAKIVPVAIVGTHKKMPKGHKFGWGFVRVVFGTPFTYAEIAANTASDKEAREALITEWERQIIEMTGRYGWTLKSAPKSQPPTEPADSGISSEATSPSSV